MNILIKISMVVALTNTILGCSSNFEKNYTGISIPLNAIKIDSPEPVQLIKTEDINGEVKNYLKKGYIPVGRAEFLANEYQRKEDVIKQATAVGAQIVILNRKDLGTSTYSVPISTPKIDYSTTNSSYNVYNNINTNVGSLQGQSNTVNYGSETKYIPMMVNSGKYNTVFLAKYKTDNLGIIAKELSNIEKQSLGQNSGVLVDVVVDNSPAYYKNILENDIILKVNNVEVFGVDGFTKLTSNKQNKFLTLDIYRQGNVIKKEVELSN